MRPRKHSAIVAPRGLTLRSHTSQVGQRLPPATNANEAERRYSSALGASLTRSEPP